MGWAKQLALSLCLDRRKWEGGGETEECTFSSFLVFIKHPSELKRFGEKTELHFSNKVYLAINLHGELQVISVVVGPNDPLLSLIKSLAIKGFPCSPRQVSLTCEIACGPQT